MSFLINSLTLHRPCSEILEHCCLPEFSVMIKVFSICAVHVATGLLKCVIGELTFRFYLMLIDLNLN